MLWLAVIIAVALPAHAKKDEDKNKGTIFEILERTDGSQAMVAAIWYGDSDEPDFGAGCGANIQSLLDDKKKKLLFFAPSNRGFERFLGLPEGGFDGMGAESIKLAFPGLLNKLSIPDSAICDLLQRHLAPTKDAKKMTAKKLLQQGSITVADEALLPIAIGDVGVLIDYIANITERDVHTVNGIIQYIDDVLVEPVPDDPPPVDLGFICNNFATCGGPQGAQNQRDECKKFLAVCDEVNNREDCAQGAALICLDISIRD
jgi:hypothetical protein